MSKINKWMEWAQRLQAISQNGLTYTENQFEIERYEQVRDIAAEIIEEHTKHEHPEVMDYLTSEKGYATPKVDTRGVVFNDKGELLMVKERFIEKWTLPGGWADVWMPPSENVERETFEESGYKVKAEKLLAVYDRNSHPHNAPFPHNIYKMFFLCSLQGGEATTSYETIDVGFFSEDNLPEILTAKTTEEQIRRMFEFYRDKNKPADFD